MPIQILQPEFIRPIYSGTWAGKPSAAGNAGKEIIVTDFNRSRWYSDGTYWRPVGGEQVVHNPILTNATASSGTLALVASVPGWQMPSDLADTPSISIMTFMAAVVISDASSVQQRLIYAGVTGATGCCLRHQYTTASAAHQGAATAWRNSDNGAFTASAANGGSSQSGNGGGDASTSQIKAAPISLYYQGGNPDGSEVIRFDHFIISIRG